MTKDLKIHKVLIVDDEPDLREILSNIVTGLNIQCETAEDGQQALEMLRKNTYHTVLSDIMMPRMTGIELLTVARVENIVTPFIFVTGFGDNVRMLQAIRLGVLDFISKPFDNEEIAEVLFRALEIGVRHDNINTKIMKQNPELFADIMKEERMISLMRARNNKLRSE